MTLQALLDNGDQVLIPAPDYPLWTASTSLAGGTPVHYLCDETQGWQPDIADIESKITERTKALVVINPNNPTGAVYSREILTQMADLARKHQLLLLADEIYDKILYDDAEHISVATVAPDLLCLTFNGLSKAYRVAGYRAGWLAITGPKDHASSFLEGINLLANMRLCPNVPAQHAIQVALGGHQSIDDLVLPGGRLLEQRDVAWTKLNEIPGVSCVKPAGRALRVPAAGPRGLRDRRRRAAGARPAAVGEDPGHPGHRIQLARTRSPADRHAAVGARPCPARSSGWATSWPATASSAPGQVGSSDGRPGNTRRCAERLQRVPCVVSRVAERPQRSYAGSGPSLRSAKADSLFEVSMNLAVIARLGET